MAAAPTKALAEIDSLIAGSRQCLEADLEMVNSLARDEANYVMVSAYRWEIGARLGKQKPGVKLMESSLDTMKDDKFVREIE